MVQRMAELIHIFVAMVLGYLAASSLHMYIETRRQSLLVAVIFCFIAIYLNLR
jgi:hypothetical protein